MALRRGRLLAVVGWCLASAASEAWASGAAARPSPAAEAAYLYRFARFVEWPPGAFATSASPLIICVFGDDPFHGRLEAVVHGKRLGRHRLAVHRGRNLERVHDCHVLFFAKAESGRVPEVLAALRDESVLTVGEGEDFLDQGGVIRFVPERNRVRFEINLAAAERNHLKLSSKLLGLARAVVPARQGE